MRRQEREVEVAEFCRATQAGFGGLGALEKLVRFKPGTTSASVRLKKSLWSLCGEQLGLRVKEQRSGRGYGHGPGRSVTQAGSQGSSPRPLLC